MWERNQHHHHHYHKKTFSETQSVHLLLFCKVGYQTWFLSTGILTTKESNLKDIQTTKQAMRLYTGTYVLVPICIWKCRLCRFKLMMFCFCPSIMSCQLLKSGPKWFLSTATCLILLFCCEVKISLILLSFGKFLACKDCAFGVADISRSSSAKHHQFFS